MMMFLLGILFAYVLVAVGFFARHYYEQNTLVELEPQEIKNLLKISAIWPFWMLNIHAEDYI